MQNPNADTASSRDRMSQLQLELARKIASYMGTAEHRATEVPGLTLHRRTTPADPCPATYEPSVIVMAQARKRVDLGRSTFIYDASPMRHIRTLRSPNAPPLE